MRVLGIDPSLVATGLCSVTLGIKEWPTIPLLDPDCSTIEVCTLSTYKPKLKIKREYSVRVSHVIDQVEDILINADLVAMEALAYAAKGEAVWVLPWIFGRVVDLCEKHDKELIIVGTTQVKKYATGNGAIKKEQAVLATVRRFPRVAITNNNEADALICAAVACRYKGCPIDSMPKAHWVDVMKKIAA